MKIEGSFHVSAPQDEVWEQLLDIENLSACVPGLESLESRGDETFSGLILVKVGPIRAQFEGIVRFGELAAPDHLEAEINAADKLSATNIQATFSSTLSPEDEGTRVDYTTDVKLRGKLAQFGMPIIRATAKQMTIQFGECLQARILQSKHDV